MSKAKALWYSEDRHLILVGKRHSQTNIQPLRDINNIPEYRKVLRKGPGDSAEFLVGVWALVPQTAKH